MNIAYFFILLLFGLCCKDISVPLKSGQVKY